MNGHLLQRRVLRLALCIGALGMLQASRAASLCSSAAGNLVVNCGFESGNFTGWTVSGNTSGGVGGAYVGVDSSNPNSGSFEAYFGEPSTFGSTGSGNQYGPVTTLSQTLTLLPREYYQVTFYLENTGCSVSDPGCPGYYNHLDVSLAGNSLLSANNLGTVSSYRAYSYTVANFASSGALQFSSTNDSGYFFLDDVQVNAVGPVPEPSTLFFALGGTALFGLVRRLRAGARPA